MWKHILLIISVIVDVSITDATPVSAFNSQMETKLKSPVNSYTQQTLELIEKPENNVKTGEIKPPVVKIQVFLSDLTPLTQTSHENLSTTKPKSNDNSPITKMIVLNFNESVVGPKSTGIENKTAIIKLSAVFPDKTLTTATKPTPVLMASPQQLEMTRTVSELNVNASIIIMKPTETFVPVIVSNDNANTKNTIKSTTLRAFLESSTFEPNFENLMTTIIPKTGEKKDKSVKKVPSSLDFNIIGPPSHPPLPNIFGSSVSKAESLSAGEEKRKTISANRTDDFAITVKAIMVPGIRNKDDNTILSTILPALGPNLTFVPVIATSNDAINPEDMMRTMIPKTGEKENKSMTSHGIVYAEMKTFTTELLPSLGFSPNLLGTPVSTDKLLSAEEKNGKNISIPTEQNLATTLKPTMVSKTQNNDGNTFISTTLRTLVASSKIIPVIALKQSIEVSTLKSITMTVKDAMTTQMPEIPNGNSKNLVDFTKKLTTNATTLNINDKITTTKPSEVEEVTMKKSVDVTTKKTTSIQNQKNAITVDQKFISNPDGTFIYSYKTETGTSVQNRAYYKKAIVPQYDSRGNKVDEAENDVLVQEGSYSYLLPDGNEIVVNYIADENGYRIKENRETL